MILSPLKLVWLCNDSIILSIPAKSPNPSLWGPSQKRGRESGAGTGEIPHVEQEHHPGLTCNVQPWLWNLLLFLSRKFSPSCQSLLLLFLKSENYVHGSRL